LPFSKPLISACEMPASFAICSCGATAHLALVGQQGVRARRSLALTISFCRLSEIVTLIVSITAKSSPVKSGDIANIFHIVEKNRTRSLESEVHAVERGMWRGTSVTLSIKEGRETLYS
jgi:hypothetical protein